MTLIMEKQMDATTNYQLSSLSTAYLLEKKCFIENFMNLK